MTNIREIILPLLEELESKLKDKLLKKKYTK